MHLKSLQKTFNLLIKPRILLFSAQKTQEEYLNKEQYLKKLTEMREKEEQEEEEQKKLHELYAKMKKREAEVSLSYVDAAKIKIENINLIPKAHFSSPDELFYFLKSLPSRVSEDNLSKCLEGLLHLSETLASTDLQSPYFAQFLEILRKNVGIVSENKNLAMIARFMDIFCISDQEIWERFERKVLSKQGNMPIDIFIQIFFHFACQKEGSEHFYDRCEEIFKANLETMCFNDLFKVFEGFFKSQYGTKEFMSELLGKLVASIKQATPEKAIKLVYMSSKAQGNVTNLVNSLEELIIGCIDQLSFDELCNCGSAFGEHEMQFRVFSLLEEKITKHVMQEVTPLKIKQILEGLCFNYKASKNLLIFLKSHILLHISYFSPIDHAKIAKSYYITEALDPQDSFFQILEKKVVERLKDLKNVKIEEVVEFVKCYCVTRNGSREFYKLLELVVGYKFNDLAKNGQLIETIYKYYATSGFCSPEMLKKLEILL